MRPWLGLVFVSLLACNRTETTVAAAQATPPPLASTAAVDAGVVDANDVADARDALDAGGQTNVTTTYRVKPITAAWLTALQHEKGFRAVALGTSGSTVRLTWSVGPSRRVKLLPPDQDYAANYVSSVKLLLDGGVAVETIDFGEEPGAIVAPLASLCKKRGYSLAAGDRWYFPQFDGVVSSFSLGVAQGNDDHLVLRGPTALYVLHRETSDGRCDDAKQGPLEICRGFEWKVRAIVSLADGFGFEESVTTAGRFDCADPSSYGALLPPR